LTVDVLSLNTFGLPKPVGKAIAERHLRIGQAVGEYEIVGFQETFSKESQNLAKGAAVAGLSYHIHTPSAQRLLSSGLSTFSTYEILESDFKAFHYSSHADALAQKGVSFTRLNLPGIGPVDVYNTHFQAKKDAADGPLDRLLLKATSLLIPGFDMPRDEIRAHNAQVLLDLIAEKDQGYPMLVLGDFNTRDDQPVYEQLTAAGLRDSFQEANPADPGYTSDGKTNPYKSNPDNRKRVDYVFYRPGENIDLQVISSSLAFDKAIDGLYVSDHYGVHTRFVFQPKATQP
jgi:endonuclease/exonuclease/phosphatase family metal-dependent hydrolase